MCKKLMNADKLLKNAGKAMYVYGVDLKERMKVIEKQRKRIAELEKQLEEKDKEIEMLNHTLNLYNLRHKGSVLPNVNQLTIQELEKVKDFVNDLSGMVGHEWRVNRISILEQLDQQIKELKGERYETSTKT